MIKEIFSLKVILKCYIGAVGYGVGYYLPAKLGYGPMVCLGTCMLLGSLFDVLSNEIVTSKFYELSKKNKAIVVALVYIGYLIAWFIVNYTLHIDLDETFFINLAFVVIIQIVLLIKNLLFKVLDNKKIDKKKLSDDELNKVVGGIEEFDWRDNTPKEKDDSIASPWTFEAEGNTEGQYFKKVNGKYRH